MKAQIIINEEHLILSEQIEILNTTFPSGWERYNVPREGWTLKYMKEEVLPEIECGIVVFVSPVPALLLLLASSKAGVDVYVFHNDNREAKELPNGKIIHTVASTGWVLV